MADEHTTPLHKRALAHLTYTAGVCDEWCQNWRLYDRLLPTAFLVGILFFLIYFITIAAPTNFPSATLLKVDKTETVDMIAQQLEARHIVHSARVFIYLNKLFNSRVAIVPGEYFFPSSQSVVTIARRMAHGDFELVPVKVTIPEGTNSYQMSHILAKNIPDFDTEGFLHAALSQEGYLFPDTYFFLPNQDPILIISTLETNFKNKINNPKIASAIKNSNRPITDIVTMASLLEKEANDTKSRQIIAGILWRRIALKMPLQVDAVFPYIIGKNSLQLTRTDLKVESPYNTYTNRGLPPGPITNPGLDSIYAAATPVASNYLFYLSDLQGNFHFSATYPEQLANQRKYLK